MKLKIGDFVSVLDADLSGRVTAIKNKIICIETNTGFEMNFEASELVKMDNHPVSYTHLTLPTKA